MIIINERGARFWFAFCCARVCILFLTSWMQRNLVKQLPADWRTLVCLIESSVCVLTVWWVGNLQDYYFFHFLCLFCWFVFTVWPEAESDKRERANELL